MSRETEDPEDTKWLNSLDKALERLVAQAQKERRTTREAFGVVGRRFLEEAKRQRQAEARSFENLLAELRADVDLLQQQVDELRAGQELC